ncbi:MAG: hypothetical protein ACHQ53_03215, partial [Polyangiales bacterium]
MMSKSKLATFVASMAIAFAVAACGSTNNQSGGTSSVLPPSTSPDLGPTTGAGIPTAPGAAPSNSGLPSNTLGTGGTSALPTAGAGGTLAPGGAGGAGMMMAPTNAMGMAGAASPGGVAWTPGGRLDASGNLIAPAADEGFQIKTSTFTLNPGDEVYNCFHAAVPSSAVFPVGEWDAQMSPGSHHFILYRAGADSTPDRTLTSPGCTSGFGGSTWLYTQGAPRGHLPFPDGVAMELAAGERIIFDMHYINTTNAPIQASVTLNVYKVK